MSYGWYFIHWTVSELPEDCIGEKNASGFCPIIDDDREGEGVTKSRMTERARGKEDPGGFARCRCGSSVHCYQAVDYSMN